MELTALAERVLYILSGVVVGLLFARLDYYLWQREIGR